jgi:hypothetical protein
MRCTDVSCSHSGAVGGVNLPLESCWSVLGGEETSTSMSSIWTVSLDSAVTATLGRRVGASRPGSLPDAVVGRSNRNATGEDPSRKSLAKLISNISAFDRTPAESDQRRFCCNICITASIIRVVGDLNDAAHCLHWDTSESPASCRSPSC